MSEHSPAPEVNRPRGGEPESRPAEPNGSVPAAAGSPRRTMALVLVAALGMYVMILTLSTALSLRLAVLDPAAKETSYGLAVSISAFVLLAAVPLAGALSDRTPGRFGRRRPWILGCLLVALLGAAVIGAVPSTSVIVVAYVVAIVAAQAAFNA